MSDKLFLDLAIAEMEDREKNDRYRTDIKLWAKDKLGYHLWNKQVEIADALIKHRRVAVKSGHGVGKSFVASIIMAWFVDTRKDMDAIAVSTAPTQPQLSIVWEYLRDHHRNANLFGQVNQDNEYKSDIGALRAMGRKPSNTNEHAFQGIHRRNGVLAVMDESCGIPESIFTGVDAITTGKYDMCLAIGNPDDINTPFGRIWTNTADDSWHKITISSYDSPNLTGEDFPEEASGGLVQPEWIESRKKAWGENSPRFKSKVLGEFSEGSGDALFTLGTLNKGFSTELDIDPESKPRLGVDVARYGDDATVVYRYHSGVVRKVGEWSKTDLVTTSENIHAIAIEEGVDEVRIDGVGIGAGVVDNLARLSDYQYSVIPLIGNAGSPDLDKWFNYRSYMWDSVRERMHNYGIDIDIDDKQLSDELGDVQYHFKNPRGSVQIEKKEDIRSRQDNKSPDYADAFIYACTELGFDPTEPVNQLTPGEEFELSLEQMLWESEFTVSPF